VSNSITFEQLRSHAQACDILAIDFDFEVIKWPEDPAGRFYRIDPSLEPRQIAIDGAGSEFFFCRPNESVLYVNENAMAGILGTSLAEWLGILVALPYWYDVLKFSGGGRLEEMRRAADRFERSSETESKRLAGVRCAIRGMLALNDLDDPVQLLWRNILASEPVLPLITGRENRPLDNMFNRFTIDQMRRPRA